MAESHLEMISPTCSAGRRMKSLNVHGKPHFARLTGVERQISREGCWYGEVLRPIWTHSVRPIPYPIRITSEPGAIRKVF